MDKKKREVTIVTAKGVCEKEKFQKLLKAGSIVADKVESVIEQKMTFVGLAEVSIKTEDKEFTQNYYVTKEGKIFTSGSEYLRESFDDIEIGEEFVVKNIKTKRGHTYRANPIFNVSDLTSDDDLQF